MYNVRKFCKIENVLEQFLEDYCTCISWNQLKLSTQHKYMYMYQEMLQKLRILNFSFLVKFGSRPCTIVQGLLSDFGVTLKNRKKSKFDRNQLKLETQHKYMYMYQEKL